MKRIFTLLLLAVLMFAPSRMRAEIVWQTATGNEWRINPNNPGDPNDSVQLAPGTKFFYLRAGRCEGTGDRLFVTIFDNKYSEQKNFAIDDFNVLKNGLCKLPFTIEDFSLKRYGGFRKTADRLITRFLGYDYMPHINFEHLEDKHGNAITVRQAYDYLRKVIMTEEEALALKKLDLSPLTYGLGVVLTDYGWSYLDVDGSSINIGLPYHWSPDLSIFRNLEELDITNIGLETFGPSHILGAGYHYYSGPYLQALKEFVLGFPDTLATSFPNLKKLTMDYCAFNATALGESIYLDFSNLKNLEYFSFSAHYVFNLILNDMPNLKTFVLAEGSGDLSATSIKISNCPQLTKIDATNAGYATLDCSEGNGNIEELHPGTFENLFCQNNSLKTLHVEGYFREDATLNCSNNRLESLTFSPISYHYYNYFNHLKVLECQNNNLTSLELPGDPIVYRTVKRAEPRSWTINDLGVSSTIWWWNGNKECWEYEIEDSQTGKITKGVGEPPFDYTIREVEEFDYGGSALRYLDCSDNSGLTTLSIPYGNQLEQLFCYSCNLTELDLSACPKLWRLGMSNNRVSSLDLSKNKELTFLYCNNNRLTELDCSELPLLMEVQLSQNRLTELNMSNCWFLEKLACDAQGGYNGRLLRKLDLTGCMSLTTLYCQNNALLSLKLDDCTELSTYINATRKKGAADMKAVGGSYSTIAVRAYTQRATEDLIVLDHDKVCIELPNGVTSGIEMDDLFGTWVGSGFDKTRNRIVQKDDKTYLVIHDICDDARGGAQAKRDVDFYGQEIKYCYALYSGQFDETLGSSTVCNKGNDNITVTVYPYVMYINPATEDLYTTPATPFYSGTIYLDYDAVVPEGTEVYVATGMQLDKNDMITGGENTTSGQLNLVKLTPADGATHVVIPALTPVYVKSPDETGLFAFSRNLANEPLATVPSGNMFKGTLTDKTVEPLSVLTLSKGRKTTESGYTSESRVGFWRYTKSTVPAHRVYIEAEELEKFGGGSARGMTFNFFDSEAEMLTAIEGLNAGSQQQPTLNNAGWYTPSGLRLNGQPTEKGVYIRNGKKVIR